MIRARVLRNPRLDSPLAQKLSITATQVTTSAGSLRAKILLRGKYTTQSTANLKASLKVRKKVIVKNIPATTIKIKVAINKVTP